MRCAKCNKNFDEEMYSGICPKCGHFNNRQSEYDVSRYFSARFDDSGKVSTSEQAAKQHEQLHKAYDKYNMHSQTAKPNAQTSRPNAQTSGPLSGYQRPSAGNQQRPAGNQGVAPGKANPYQSPRTAIPEKTYPAGNSDTYGQNKYGKANAYGEEKKNYVTPLCIVIAILAIAVTVTACQLKKQSLEENYYTLDFEQETAQAGEMFGIGAQLLIVDNAETVDTSALEGMPEGEKMVAVSVELLPTEEEGDGSGAVYVSDGSSYKGPLDDYTVRNVLYGGDYSLGNDILSRYDFKGNTSTDGKTGKLYFLVDENAEEISVCFEEGNQKGGLYVLNRRVSVSLQLEEDGI